MTRTRRVVQGLFLALVLVGVFGLQANCERWCPFGGVEAIYTYVAEGNMLCSLGVSNFFILGGVLAATLLVRRAFCGYMCPLGTISEWLRSLGSRLWNPGTARLGRLGSRCWDCCKYGVLAIVLVLTYRAGELIFRGFDPCYALLSRHGEDITFWAYVVERCLVVPSSLIVVPFCRWFCPLAAVLNPFSRFGWTAHSSRCRDTATSADSVLGVVRCRFRSISVQQVTRSAVYFVPAVRRGLSGTRRRGRVPCGGVLRWPRGRRWSAAGADRHSVGAARWAP